MITITVWSDFACPYCYIGETRLEDAIRQLSLDNEVEINYRAFELDPSAPKEVTTTTPERFAMKYRMSLEDAEKQIEEISKLGKDLGIDFRYSTTLYSNTRDAHRLMKLAEHDYDRATVGKLNQALFDAYFTRNLVLSDHKVLTDIAKSVGMDETKVKEVLDSDRYDDEVRFDEREAAMRGVRGVPYFVINGEMAIPGAMSLEGFRAALEREVKRAELQSKATETERPHQCGPDGCQLF